MPHGARAGFESSDFVSRRRPRSFTRPGAFASAGPVSVTLMREPRGAWMAATSVPAPSSWFSTSTGDGIFVRADRLEPDPDVRQVLIDEGNDHRIAADRDLAMCGVDPECALERDLLIKDGGAIGSSWIRRA
jgi:hypothetical protein